MRLVTSPVRQGRGNGNAGQYQMKLRQENNELFLERQDHYFKMLENQLFKEQQLNDILKSERIQSQRLVEQNCEVHTKCVKYHDLVYGMINTVAHFLQQMKVVEDDEVQQLLDLAQLEEVKLTMDVK